jgi:adenylate cyclase
MGELAGARRVRDDGLVWAEACGHPYSRAVGRVFGTLLALELRDLDRLRLDTAALALEPSAQDAWHVQATVEAYLGYLDVLDGARQAGIARIQRALDDPRGAAQSAPGADAFLARVLLEACAVAGAADAGLAAADQLLKLGNNHVWEAEACRRRAEFLGALGAPHDAIEAEYERALRVARRQGARLFELRAASSLLRRREANGDTGGMCAARDVLSGVVAAFPPGTHNLDLDEAIALLSPHENTSCP